MRNKYWRAGRRALGANLGLALAACAGGPAPSDQSPGVVFPTSLAEGKNPAFEPVPSARPAASSHVVPEPALPLVPRGGTPDPEPLRQREQWEYHLHWNAGTVEVGSVEAKQLPEPLVTARRFGRFAIELWIGQELVERVRFDFPLLGAHEPTKAGGPPTLGAKANVWQTVLVPAAARARRAVLLDRATNTQIALPWPPDAPTPPAAPPPPPAP